MGAMTGLLGAMTGLLGGDGISTVMEGGGGVVAAAFGHVRMLWPRPPQREHV